MQGDEKFKKDRFVLSVAFSPNGERLACGSQDGTVAIFDVASGKFLHHLEGHFKPVRALTFTPGTLHCLMFHCVFTLLILLLYCQPSSISLILSTCMTNNCKAVYSF